LPGSQVIRNLLSYLIVGEEDHSAHLAIVHLRNIFPFAACFLPALLDPSQYQAGKVSPCSFCGIHRGVL
jgi:hypothetical protein